MGKLITAHDFEICVPLLSLFPLVPTVGDALVALGSGSPGVLSHWEAFALCEMLDHLTLLTVFLSLFTYLPWFSRDGGL